MFFKILFNYRSERTRCHENPTGIFGIGELQLHFFTHAFLQHIHFCINKTKCKFVIHIQKCTFSDIL